MRVEKNLVSPLKKISGEKVSALANNWITPLSMGGLVLSSLIGLNRNSNADAITSLPAANQPSNALLNPNFWNGIGEGSAALGDLSRPGSFVGCVLRMFLNFFISDPAQATLINKAFYMATPLIATSWAVSESPVARGQLKNISGFGSKLAHEAKFFLTGGKSFFKGSNWAALGKEMRALRSFGALAQLFSKRTAGIILAVAWSSLLGGSALVADHLLNPKAREVKGSALTEASWLAVKGSMSLLSLSYLSKVFSPRYRTTNGVIAAILAGATLAANIVRTVFADNPQKGQASRVAADLLARLESWRVRSIHSQS